MFFQKSINLTAYTYDPSYMNTCKPEYQSKEKPSWLEKMKNYYFQKDEASQIIVKNPTIGLCPGMRDFLHMPVQLKMWADLEIKINPDGTWTFYSRPNWDVYAAGHFKEQYGDAYPNRVAIKLLSPWYFVSDDPVKFMFIESHYSTSFFRDNDIVVPPAVIDYKFQHSTNVHLSFPIRPESYVIRLKHGTPLISMFPLTERKINFDVKQIPRAEFDQINEHMPKMFIGRYFKQPGKK